MSYEFDFGGKAVAGPDRYTRSDDNHHPGLASESVGS
jgi:hypothetical protein